MEGLVLWALVVATAAGIVILARRAARPSEPVLDPDDPDPHAGTLREVASQQGPRIYPVDHGL